MRCRPVHRASNSPLIITLSPLTRLTAPYEGESVRADPVGATWSATPHASHSRRALLKHGLQASILIGGWPLIDRPAAIRNAWSGTRFAPAREPSTTTLVLATNRAPSDLDPHSAYDPGSQIALQGPFEGLIQVRPAQPTRSFPCWRSRGRRTPTRASGRFACARESTFQDGTPLDAEAARASFERLLRWVWPRRRCSRGSSTIRRGLPHRTQRTLVFDLGRPQPLFEAAIAAPVGAAIANAAALRAHEVDGDWGHGWAQTHSDGVGTGPYRVTSFDVEEGVVLERYPEYWRGWAGTHFEGVTIRVVTEPETRLRVDREWRGRYRHDPAIGHC